MASRKIKIGFFIDEYNLIAGTEIQLHGILRNLDPSKVEATLVTLRKPVPEKHQTEIPWPVECLHVNSLFSPNAFIKFCKLVRWLSTKRFDIAMIYFVDTNQFVVPACYLARVKKIVINRRDMGYWYKPGILRRLNLINRMADVFLVNAIAVKKLVEENEHFPPDHIKVIYNGLWKRDDSQYQTIKNDPELDPSSPVIGIVASLRKVKRIDQFIEVAALVLNELPQAQFHILGQGELESDLKKQATRLGIDEKIKFLGQINNVGSYLQNFDIGLLTSDSEGLSNTLIEYAAAGVPAVAFNTGGNNEVIDDGVTGYLIPQGDVKQMAEKVVKILNNNKLRNGMSEQSKRLAQRYSPENIRTELMDFFCTI
jgi:L-malate glycosyltransferase